MCAVKTFQVVISQGTEHSSVEENATELWKSMIN